jgi:hypothetical protein
VIRPLWAPDSASNIKVLSRVNHTHRLNFF